MILLLEYYVNDESHLKSQSLKVTSPQRNVCDEDTKIGPYEICFIFAKFCFFHFNWLEFRFYTNFTIRECVLLMWMNEMSMTLH